ncbi:MAG: WecB/TagA/CpsF family glycosyltransferase [Lachnospiraceae bacterium]|nr:WecB/TagA/CpsF family glycosyltransferase [Lachnospiraceae bacterium]
MKERVQLLGIRVDIFSTKDAGALTRQYIEEESSRVVYFVNSGTLLLLQENDKWKDLVDKSEMVLPGDVSVNDSINEALGHKRDSFFFESFFDGMLDYAIETGRELLLVTENEEKFTSVQKHVHEKRPYLAFSGMFLTEKGESLGHIVNEINSVAPDILILALDDRRQLELLEQFRTQINAGLFMFAGNILYSQAVAEAEVPEPIQKLKIGELYRWFRVGGRTKTLFRDMKIRLKLRFEKRGKSDVR